jgi:hypothetical protein
MRWSFSPWDRPSCLYPLTLRLARYGLYCETSHLAMWLRAWRVYSLCYAILVILRTRVHGNVLLLTVLYVEIHKFCFICISAFRRTSTPYWSLPLLRAAFWNLPFCLAGPQVILLGLIVLSYLPKCCCNSVGLPSFLSLLLDAMLLISYFSFVIIFLLIKLFSPVWYCLIMGRRNLSLLHSVLILSWYSCSSCSKCLFLDKPMSPQKQIKWNERWRYHCPRV